MLNFSTFYRNAAARATGSVFVLMGFVFGTWAAAIPYVKQKFGLDEAGLGLLLLCFPIGVTLMNPFAVMILNRFGPVRATLGSLASGALVFMLPIAMPNVWLTGAALIVAGFGLSSTNITMNTCASLLEQAGVRLFSTCHGLWSTGAMAGSAIATVVASAGLPREYYSVVVGGLVVFLCWRLLGPLSGLPVEPVAPKPAPKSRRKFSMPNALLWSLILVSLCTNLTEGTMTDWSAVYMREVAGAGPDTAGWGFTIYATFMAAGRFLGDELIARFGSRRMLWTGGSVVVAGLAMAIAVPVVWCVLLGFALVGAGVSLGAPVLYAAAAKVPGMAKGVGLATMNTFAMAGFLGGPAVIGFLAKAFDLRTAFGLVAVFACYWVWKSRRMQW